MSLLEQKIANDNHIRAIDAMLLDTEYLTPRFIALMQMREECVKSGQILDAQIRKELRCSAI